MKSLIREYNWAASPLGKLKYWPQSLCFTLDLMLHSAFPMFLFWGKENTCFYNDAFRPLLGAEGKHPSALGDAGFRVWTEIWETVEPLVGQAKEGKSTRLYEDLLLPIYRNGKLEDAYWTFSYNPVKNDTGTIAGVLSICNETTRQVVAREAANTVRLQLHQALEACDLGTWDLDPETMFFRCNEKTKEIFGLAKAEHVDLKTAVDVIHPDDRAAVRRAIDAAFSVSSGGKYEVDYTVIHPQTGEHHIIRAKGKAYFNELNKPEKFTGTVQDITLERMASRQQEKLQQLVENSADYMSMATLDGQMTYINPAGRVLVGLTAEDDLATLQIKDFYPEEQFDIVKTVIIPALGEKGHWSGLVKIKQRQTGEEIPCQGNYMLIRDPASGQVISRGLTLRDLRPEMQARKELHDSEKRFRNLVQEAPVATGIYIGEEMRIQWANDAMIRTWGKDQSVIGKTVRHALPELEGQPFHDLLRQVYTTGQMYQATEDRVELVVDGRLQTFFFNFSYKPLRDAEGTIYGILNMAIDVTEQVKTKRKLQESETAFRNLIMQAPVGICLLGSENYRVEIVNDQYLLLVGRERERFEGQPIWDVLPEARAQGFDALLKQVQESGQPYYGNEQPVELLRNGRVETVHVNFVYEPLFDNDGKVRSILVIVFDITPQVTARRSIEEAEQRARLAVQSAKLGTYEVNVLTKEVIPTPRFCELFDVDANATQYDYVARIHPDDLPARQKAHELSQATGRLEYECRILRRDGTTNWLQIFGQLYFNDQRQPFKIVGIVQDITQQKTMEEEREKFLALSHYSRDFIGMCDMNLKTLYVNRAGITMLGIEGDGLTASLWDCFYPEDRAYLADTFFPLVKKEGYGEVEIRFRHFKTGVPVWVIYSVFLIQNSKGEPSVMATVSRDITERKTMEAELERRVKERTADLQRLNDELQQFTYVSSHDLKEPLRKIQVFGHLAMQQAGTTDPKLSTSLVKITQAASRMSSLLTDLINYSTLSDLATPFRPVDLNQVLAEAEEDAEVMIREKRALIQKTHLSVVDGIPFQLGRLFVNLLQNALKFSRADLPPNISITGTAATALEQQQYALGSAPHYKITFSDNGIGFRPEFAQKIFVVFQRLNNRDQYSGNGIGLSLCKKIVENHRGLIFAQSEPDKGAVFTVFLPLVQSSSHAA